MSFAASPPGDEHRHEDDSNDERLPTDYVVTSPFLTGDVVEEDENDDDIRRTRSTALVVLNAPIPNLPPHAKATGQVVVGRGEDDGRPSNEKVPNVVFDRLWHMSSYRVCADGGANRLYKGRCCGPTRQLQSDETKCGVSNVVAPPAAPPAVPAATTTATTATSETSPSPTATTTSQRSDKYIPNLIVGDLDSIHPVVQQYFEKEGCDIWKVLDQDRNDLDKALDAVQEEHQRRLVRCRKRRGTGVRVDHETTNNEDYSNSSSTAPFTHVAVYGAFGGRFDQEMASLQALHKWSDQFGAANLWLYDEHTCACLLRPNSPRLRRNVVTMCPSVENLKSVGLIPLGGRCDKVITSGFRWNLDEDSMEFGGLVSTSNEMLSPTVFVEATHRLVFTAGVKTGAAGDWDEDELLASLSSEPNLGTST